ncbi:endolytic transglycosylase MltG [Candidatus Saccharibacteria bacterium]|nr:MAG: endolytic transglycosylase MltG [Candidatus Saccharibacteria bacterium]
MPMPQVLFLVIIWNYTMQNDVQQVQQPPQPPPQQPVELPPIDPLPEQQEPPKKRPFFRRKSFVISAAISLLILVLILSLIGWFVLQLQPVNAQGQQRRIVIKSGSAPSEIATLLQESGIIKSAFAFETFAKLKGDENKLKAGTYVLSPAQSANDVLAHLVEGRVDPLRVTIVPGLTLAELKSSLQKYGFSADAIDKAFAQQYAHPLLASKPADASLEGYIFPETYDIEGDATVADLLTQSFDEFQKRLQQGQIAQKLQARNMNLHQAVTLASVIQKEVSSPEDQKQISQIFQKRLATDMPLGADATFVYAAKQLGVEPSVNLQSPYNTRINKGLPPGPIANFNFSAIDAVAAPAPGEFLYFVSGDDGKTYFATTLEEHEKNTKTYCIKLCELF